MTLPLTPSPLVGRSPAIEKLRWQIAKAAASPLPILIEGQTGVGKELVAEAIHRESRRPGSLVALNVSAIADTLFEDTFFGHVKGAFTGALRDHDGVLAEAHNGTLFLDEISTLAPTTQAKLLRVVETRRFRPLGARHDRTSNFRLVAATNQPIAGLVTAGLFRDDLAHRLTGLTLRVPPLKERLDDVSMLATHFAEQFASQGGRFARLADSAVAALEEYEWPGNVRELRAVIEVAITMSESALVTRQDISALLADRRRATAVDEESEGQRRRLMELLVRHEWDTSAVALELGVDRGTVYRWLRSLGIPTLRRRARGSGTTSVAFG
ncbi:MAG: sigma-54-dependent Fis family transcriptional regulator [Gemmatimonadaceae bacterium]|nr:sigma-54-dependent Fis family transcriptional regulator [Gemmatimonadaceae bacterium]